MQTIHERQRFSICGGVLVMFVLSSLQALAAEPREPVRLVGQVRPAEPIIVAARVAGVIESIRVEVGDRIEQGQELAQIDPTRYKLQFDRARANFALAAARLNAIKAGAAPEELLQSPLKERLVAAEAELHLAEADVRLANYDLETTRILAPSDGIVLAKSVSLGQSVALQGGPGKANGLFELADLGRLEVVANVAEVFASDIVAGLPCRVRIATLPKVELAGKVAWVAPSVNTRTGSFEIGVHLAPSDDSDRLKPGMSVQVECERKN